MSWRTVAALLAAAVVWLVLYGLLCLASPFRPCWRCEGQQSRRSCRRCKGTGLRLRRGRYVINYLRTTRTAAARADARAGREIGR